MLDTGLSIVLPLLVGIAATYYYSNRRALKCIAFERRVLDPIGKTHPGVEILFEGEKVDSLSEWTIAIWNAGNQTIQKQDIAEPIEILFRNSRILKGTAPLSSRTSTKPTLSSSSDTITLSLEYLDKKDAIAFTVYAVPGHGKRKVSVRGNIRGIPRGPSIESDLEIPSNRQKLLVLSTMILLLGLGTHACLYVISSGHQLHLWGFDQALMAIDVSRSPVSKWAKFAFFCISFILFVGMMGLVTREIIRWFIQTPRWVRDNVTQIVRHRK